jgi:hypothetical protein
LRDRVNAYLESFEKTEVIVGVRKEGRLFFDPLRWRGGSLIKAIKNKLIYQYCTGLTLNLTNA